ncbi:MAG: alpha/beta hydrolase [Sphingobacteriales bacterium JAD_PAG50586_3]|nr:MAG: alpha/beta hydrolase [Sphingobacteriales bacterium JAD_PAG50586_3]
MRKAYFEYEGYKVHYAAIGNGDKYLLAFHGYGQEGAVFNAFENSLGRHYTIIAFDLFHHGESAYPLNLPPDTALETHQFKLMLEVLLTKLGVDTFGLMGYSMGGRICLQLLTLFGDRVNELYLFAPDGIKRSNGYAFGTYTLLGKALFKLMIDAGGIMLSALKLGNTLGIVNNKAYTFFVTQVNTKAKRRKLYDTLAKLP